MSELAAADVKHIVNSGLSERLISEQLLGAAAASDIQQQARTQGFTFIKKLLDGGQLDSATLAKAASEESGAPLLDLKSMVDDHLSDDLGPRSLIRKHRALPLFRRGDRLFIAIADPTNTSALAEFKFATGIATGSIVVE